MDTKIVLSLFSIAIFAASFAEQCPAQINKILPFRKKAEKK